MFSLPTFLSFPWSLPLPSLPSISLPANIQKRFLSYVLKRSLGRFVRAGGLDVERIQAQIGEGRVEIEGLELDTEAINSLIPDSIPLRISAGSLDRITARLPFPNLWSAPLTIALETLSLDLLLVPPQAGKGKSKESSLPSSPSLDLASSVTTAADEFLHEELDAYEEAELDRSIRQSIILSSNDPFANDELPGAFPFGAGGSANPHSPGSPLPVNVESTTVLAGLIERVLARLEFKVDNVKVRIHHEDSKHGGVFELRVGGIRYADESSATTEEKRSKTIRTVTVSAVNLYMLPPRSTASVSVTRPRFFGSGARSASTSSASSTSTGSSLGDNDDMVMSMAVADLRHSVATTMASGASVYQSAMSEVPEEVEEDHQGRSSGEKQGTDTAGSRRSRSATPTPTAKEPEGTLLLSFGTEDVVLRMTTTRPEVSVLSTTPAIQVAESPSTPVDAKRLPSVNLDLSIGTVAAVILPTQAATVLSAMQLASKPSGDINPAPPEKVQEASPTAPNIATSLGIKALFTSIVYDLNATTNPAFASSLPQFWQKPGMTDLPVGHLKIRLDTLQATYRSPEKRSTNRTTTDRSRLSRKSSLARSQPAEPSISISLLDASIFEYLASAPSGEEDSPPGGSFPVLIFDPNLVKQYDHSPASGLHTSKGTAGSESIFPEFDALDWRNSGLQRRGAAGERAWRVKQKGRGVLKGGVNAPVPEAGPVVHIGKSLSPQSPAHVTSLPIHIFLDLSLLERLLPMLRHISPAVKRQDTAPSSPIRSTRPVMPARRSESYVLDDLDAQARRPSIQPSQVAVVKCPMVRLSIRCPAPINHRGTWGDGAHLRSGIVTLDLHGLHARLDGAQDVSAKRPSQKGQSQGGTTVEWNKMMLFFCRVPSTKSAACLVVGPLAPEPGDVDPAVLLPSISMKSSQNAINDSKTTSITCRIPSVQAQIRQSTIEGLQFFADDLTHWLDGAFGDGSRPKPRDELKMIGSRFFGSKASSSASSSAMEEDDDSQTSATIIRIIVTETDIALHVPRAAKTDHQGNRILAVRASDLNAEMQSNATGRQESSIALSIMDAEFSDISSTIPTKIIARTTPLTLTVQNHPIVHLRFSSLTDKETGTKETNIKTVLSSITFYISADIGWMKDLAAFVKTPEGVFEDVVPSEVTRISLEVFDGSIHVTPPAPASPGPNVGTGALVLVLGALDIKTDLTSEAEDSVVEVGLTGSGVLIVDDMGVTTTLRSGVPPIEAWSSAGYAKIVDLTETEVQIWRDLTGTGETMADVLHCRVTVTACADSLAYLGPLASDLSRLVPSESKAENAFKSPATLDQTINVFASIDEDAFNRIPDMISGADLIEDDLPTNLDYLDHATRRVEVNKDRSTGETLRSWQATGEGDFDARLNSEVNGETIKILYDQPFEMDEQYWDRLAPVSRGYLDEAQFGKIRLKVHDCSVNVLLYDGYDWQRTRKAIEDEIKTVRRRLERIRQLLASGQTADETVENTRSVLFNSIYIGLDQSREMDSAALLAAIDEELGDLGNDASSISSWQTDFPAGHPNHPSQPARTKKTRLKGKRLTRSKKPQMEFSLQGIKVDLDLFGEESSTASRVHVALASMEILDHIKTSTWKKFLTEMKADSRGNVRETDADMVRLEVIGVRPSLPSPEEEYRLRAKILPLRLHVDQDALDFLKRFFSFSSPVPTVSTSQPRKASAEPFFQHVEIFPIELKLDYKPKRVDFAALREGKTMELMNFFHFDGAEMTLRHITLSGISGVTRLSTTLQDLWTPDVKANQLADVISGVSPIRSIVNVGSGVADLILLPIEQYRKDGRVARGVQRGTNSFVRSTALETMKLGAKLATGTQVILEKAEGVLGGKIGDNEVVGEVSNVEREGEVSSEDEVEVVSRYANQPTGAKEGVQAAYKSLSKNVNAAAQTILAVPMEVYERSGDTGPLKAVVRAVPIAVLKPMIGASEAVSKTLLGVRNSLDPQGRDELGDKYK